jgi:5-oxopent-3-ene-1,2,5-tricarboxylate decarboxylase/2-hydroxyhepta-2,4-diene-1,7-dioate isomerase
MRRARFAANGTVYEGTVQEDGQLLSDQGRVFESEQVTWLPPVVPPKVLGLAINYAEHMKELDLKFPDMPVLFIKANTSLVGHGGEVVYPTGAEYMHYEGELAVVIGRTCRKVTRQNALDYVRGYTIANDVTVRDFVLNFYRPPIKAKSFDTFGPLGPWIVEGEIENPAGLELKTFVNGELRQHGNTRDLIFDVPYLIEYISDFMTLEANDVILTGTPKGISPIHPGDLVRVEIEGIGALENRIVAEE